MNTLLDTNILMRAAQPGHPMNRTAVDALAALQRRGLCPQSPSCPKSGLCFITSTCLNTFRVLRQTVADENSVPKDQKTIISRLANCCLQSIEPAMSVLREMRASLLVLCSG